jgi:hypothetical protein
LILPGKHIRADRSLIVVGGEILQELSAPRTVSELWDAVRARRGERKDVSPITYDWFVLALTLLFAMSVLRLEGDELVVGVR